MLSFPVFVKFQPRRPPLFSSIGKVPTRSESLPTICFKFFTCNTYGRPRKRCKQKTYGLPKSFSLQHLQNTGGGDQSKAIFHLTPYSTYLPSSVYSSKFRIPQPLCLPLLRKLPGVWGILPILELASQVPEVQPG